MDLLNAVMKENEIIKSGLGIVLHELVSGLTDIGTLSETYKDNLINEINTIVSIYVTIEKDLDDYVNSNKDTDITN